MYFTAAGSRFFIGVARPAWDARVVVSGDFNGEIWTVVEGLQSLGRIGGEWETSPVIVPDKNDPDAPTMATHEKTARPNMTMQIVTATVEDDPGQLAMLAAEAGVHAFPFRIELPTGALRTFMALVVSAEQVVDEANSVLGWSFGLLLQSNLLRA